MGRYDEILRKNNDEERIRFLRKFQAVRDDVVAFVNDRMGWDGAGQYQGWLKGSFNIGYVVKLPKGGDDHDGIQPYSVFIRFPVCGRTYSPWGSEKIQNEVMVLEYLREHTTIPVPRKPTKSNQDRLILDLGIDQSKLEIVYDQIADYVLQLSRLRLPRIGAISKASGGGWAVTRRPLTYDMNELAMDYDIPVNELPSGPFDRASDYFERRVKEMWTHLQAQRNICETADESKKRFHARCSLTRLISKHCIDNDEPGEGGIPFGLFSDDFGPFNMLADPETLRITAVFDFEFTNSMPGQYLYDVPSWLLLASPHCWLERDDKAGFEELFIPQMDLFIRHVERVEARSPPPDGIAPANLLSAQMRDSWATGRFWFNYAMRTSVDADTVLPKALSDWERQNPLNEEEEEEMQKFVGKKKVQFAAYLEDKKNDHRFKK